MDNNDIAGEYQLQGVREMASGFLLKSGGDFQFYFSYGALDRYGSGKWSLIDGKILFNSGKHPSHDFRLQESKRSADKHISIRITDPNVNLLSYVYASPDKDDQGSWKPADKNGLIVFPWQPLHTLSLVFEFCPERISTFSDLNKGHNDFTFLFEPWLMEVFFMDFSLQTMKEGLHGPHPLMKEGQFLYARV